MSRVDEKAVFSQRIKELDLLPLADKFTSFGWTTYGSFAFAAGLKNNTIDDDAFVKRVLKRLFGEDPETKEVKDSLHEANVRRLHFESFTIYVAEIEATVTRPDIDTKVRAMPGVVMEERLEAIRKKLEPAIKVRGWLEPAESVVEKYNDMQIKGKLRYLKWEEIITQDQELRGGPKKTPAFLPDAGGVLRASFVTQDQTAPVNGDWPLSRMFTRRGVAMHMARLVDYEIHDQFVQWMLEEYEQAPLPGYAKISLNQVLRVDEEVFIRLANVTRKGLALDPLNGAYPLNHWLPKIMVEPRIVALLAPMRGGGGGGGGEPGVGKEKKRQAQQDNEMDRLKNKIRKLESGKDKGKGKGKDKGKDKGKSAKDKKKAANTPMPRGLEGMAATTRKGIRICYAYNLPGGCKLETGMDHMCDKGKHVCCMPGCEERHSVLQHHS